MTREEILMAGCQEVLRNVSLWRKADNMAGRVCSILEGAIERAQAAASEVPKVRIEVCDGEVVGVTGLPDDSDFEIHDFDDDPDDIDLSYQIPLEDLAIFASPE